MATSEVTATRAWRAMRKWLDSQQTDNPQGYYDGLQHVMSLYREMDIPTLVPLLGQLLSLRGKPYSLVDQFPFEPMFKRKDMPPASIYTSGRQTGKTQSLGAQAIIQSAVESYFNTLFVCPLFEQTRRLSSNIIRPLLVESPLRHILVGSRLGGAGNVLQRTLANESIMHFTFAFTDCERARGISASRLAVDETQDINFDFIPILEECLSASTWKLIQFTGTPKSKDNTLYLKWLESSQAEWVIPCECGRHNTCSTAYDLDHMIQKKGLCCRWCSRFLNPRVGHYEHMVTADYRPQLFPGYHIPQPIMPMHYDIDRDGGRAWRLIIKKKGGNQVTYYNECLGEAKDTATVLISREDLRKVAKLPWNNDFSEAMDRAAGYQSLVLGVDWGGGAGGVVRRIRGNLVVQGGSTSFTVATVVGFKVGSIMPEVVYSERLSTSLPPLEESKRVLQIFKMFGCYRLAHDFGGAGYMREVAMIQQGLPPQVICPLSYTVAPSKGMMHPNPPGQQSSRWFYSLDKPRSLSLLCLLIKAQGAAGNAMLPQWQSISDIAEDFLALVEDRRDRPGGSDLSLITKHPKLSDDFVHSVNFACQAHWYAAGYPELASQAQGLSEADYAALNPNPTLADWEAA